MCKPFLLSHYTGSVIKNTTYNFIQRLIVKEKHTSRLKQWKLLGATKQVVLIIFLKNCVHVLTLAMPTKIWKPKTVYFVLFRHYKEKTENLASESMYKQDRLTLCRIWSFRKKRKISRTHFCSTPEKKTCSKFQREIKNSDCVGLL